MPRVSFLIVAHDAGRFLEPAVQSALGQTYTDLEVVLVDNASTDGSVDALDGGVGGSDRKRLRVVRASSNLGAYGGALKGLEHCSGELVARMDADDISVPARLAIQVACLEADPRLGAVAAQCELVDVDLRHLAFAPEPPVCTSDEIARAVRKWMPVIHAATTYRRSALEEVPYRPAFFTSGDFDQIARLAERRPIICVPLPLLQYRQHAASLSSAKGRLQDASAGAVVMMSARRRSGQDERIDEELAFARAIAERVETRFEVLRGYAERLAQEGHLAEAAYFARQGLRDDPSAVRWAKLAGTVASELLRSRGKLKDALSRMGRSAYDAAMP